MMERIMNKLKDRKGFTLVEIIVVLVVLAILAAIAIPSVMGYVEDARKSEYIADARSVYLIAQTEEARYMAENNIKTIGDNDYETTVYKKYGLNYTIEKDTGVITDGKFSTMTGLKNVYVMHRGDVYIITWKDNKNVIQATVQKNKKITIDKY